MSKDEGHSHEEALLNQLLYTLFTIKKPGTQFTCMLTLVLCVYDDIGVLILMLKLVCLQLLGNNVMYPGSRYMEKEGLGTELS